MSVLFRGKITRCWSQRCDRISWQTWVKLATMGNVGEKQFVSLQGENASSLVADRIVPLRNVCTMILFCLFILGGGLTLLYDSQERHNFALHLHNSLQEKRCISDLFPQWRRLIISFRRRECDRWINDVDHRGQEGAELWFTKCQLRSRALSGDRGDTIADTSRRNTFPSQSLSVSSGTGWTDWISRRSRAKKKKKKPGEVVQMSDRHVERQPVSLITCGTCHSRKSIADKIIETESRLPFSVSGSYIVYSGSLSYWDTWIEQIHVLSDTVLCPVLWGSGWRMQTDIVEVNNLCYYGFHCFSCKTCPTFLCQALKLSDAALVGYELKFPW